MRQVILWSAIAGVALSAACSPRPAPPAAGLQSEKRTGDEQADLNRQIVSALQAGQYRDAIQAARRSHASRAEIDFAVGEIILQGSVDTDAAQKPAETSEAAIALLEKSALRGHRPAISGLAALFFTGLRKGAAGRFLIAPDSQLNACWEAVKTAPGKASSCVSLRTGH